MQEVVLENAHLRAEISNRGAELIRLQDGEGHDLLWNGDARWWSGRAPLLFPIVGKVPDNSILIDGKSYPILQHGFARTSDFSLLRCDGSECLLRLKANEGTRERYPFDFTLDVRITAEGATLRISATVVNPNHRTLPVSFGFHPAFRWPLPYGGLRDAHEIIFDQAEPGSVRRLAGGLIDGTPVQTPVQGRTLVLSDRLFDDDAIVFDQLDSRGLIYGVPGLRSIRLAFPAMPHLGIWTKPCAGFICIEPWQGFAAPMNFRGELSTKPGIVAVPAGSSAKFSLSITLPARSSVRRGARAAVDHRARRLG
jgi:galactose mutarotase-like enzyme